LIFKKILFLSFIQPYICKYKTEIKSELNEISKISNNINKHYAIHKH